MDPFVCTSYNTDSKISDTVETLDTELKKNVS